MSTFRHAHLVGVIVGHIGGQRRAGVHCLRHLLRGALRILQIRRQICMPEPVPRRKGRMSLSWPGEAADKGFHSRGWATADTVLALHRVCAAVRLFDVCGGCRQQACWADTLHGMRPQQETYESGRAAKYAQHNECQRTARKVHLAAQAEAVEPSSDLRHTFAPLASSAETSACRPRPAAAISAVAPGPPHQKSGGQQCASTSVQRRGLRLAAAACRY